MANHQSTNFIVVKSTKSVGIAILLTLLFGPIGLFYASITGGIIMTLTPFLLFVLLIMGALGESSSLLLTSLGLLVIFALTYWLICIIWAAIAVYDYNNELFEEANRRQVLQSTIIINPDIILQQIPGDQPIHSITNVPVIGEPTIQEWLKQNPHKSINDYFQKFGNSLDRN